MTENEAWGQAFENGRKVGDAEGYARGLREAMKPGRWESIEGGIAYRCSCCGYTTDYSTTRHCPHCGARMDGDGDG